jgi:hypothetical protein
VIRCSLPVRDAGCAARALVAGFTRTDNVGCPATRNRRIKLSWINAYHIGKTTVRKNSEGACGTPKAVVRVLRGPRKDIARVVAT